MKEHIYKTKINMIKAEKNKNYFLRQIDKLIKEKEEFESGIGFNSRCSCEKCLKRMKKRDEKFT